MNNETIVMTDRGAVRGTLQGDVRLFQGIPYAAPPVGPFRWQSPQPMTAWAGIRDATKPGNWCAQLASDLAATPGGGSEDCLFLNVTVPCSADSEHLKPVMVWMHGGGFTSGAGSVFRAHRLAVQGDVVVVTINYRLGIFGYFGYPGLAGSGGFGLEDQQAALRWVQRNAVAFGGDPGNVTLFGESAGAYSAGAQLVSPLARGLFQRVVIQSGPVLGDYPAGTFFPGLPALSTFWRSPEEVQAVGAMVATQLGCPDPANALEYLRSLSTSTLLKMNGMFSGYAYGNAVLPDNPANLLREGALQTVPVMLGCTRDETRFFVSAFYDAAGHPVTATQYSDLLAQAFGANASEVARHYPLDQYASPSVAWATVTTDRTWTLATWEQAHVLADQVPLYAYEFADRQAPHIVAFPPNFDPGAYHSSEVGYLFDYEGAPTHFSAEQQDLADLMIQYWAHFAHTGDPYGTDLPDWPRFLPAENRPYVQSLKPGQGNVQNVDLDTEHHLTFWKSLV